MAKEVVERIKSELLSKGWVFPEGNNEAAFAITNLVARELGLYIVYKPTGNKAVIDGVGYSVDLVTDKKQMWDVLIHGGFSSEPTFDLKPGVLDEGMWREPLADYPRFLPKPEPNPQDPLNPIWVMDEFIKLHVRHDELRDQNEALNQEILKLQGAYNQIVTVLNEMNQFIHLSFDEVFKRQDRSYNSLIGRINPIK
jgi:hypothetical protein